MLALTLTLPRAPLTWVQSLLRLQTSLPSLLRSRSLAFPVALPSYPLTSFLSLLLPLPTLPRSRPLALLPVPIPPMLKPSLPPLLRA